MRAEVVLYVGIKYNFRSIHQQDPNVFIGAIHTSDVIGDPESKLGNVDVYANGGRLQPGCYYNQNYINQCL